MYFLNTLGVQVIYFMNFHMDIFLLLKLQISETFIVSSLLRYNFECIFIA